jgi:hypothetical protein
MGIRRSRVLEGILLEFRGDFAGKGVKSLFLNYWTLLPNPEGLHFPLHLLEILVPGNQFHLVELGEGAGEAVSIGHLFAGLEEGGLFERVMGSNLYP